MKTQSMEHAIDNLLVFTLHWLQRFNPPTVQYSSSLTTVETKWHRDTRADEITTEVYPRPIFRNRNCASERAAEVSS